MSPRTLDAANCISDVLSSGAMLSSDRSIWNRSPRGAAITLLRTIYGWRRTT
jgi:hypothetical protein